MHATAGLEVVRGTEQQRHDIHGAVGEMVLHIDTIIEGAASVKGKAAQVRERLGWGMLEFTNAALLVNATLDTGNVHALLSTARYDEAGGGESALGELSTIYHDLDQERMPGILAAAQKLKDLIMGVDQTCKTSYAHAEEVARLTEQGNDSIRLYAEQANITLSD